MFSRISTIAIAALLAVMPAFSAITTYSTRGTWEMDVTSYNTIDFENFTPSGPIYGTTGAVHYDNGSYSQPSDCSASTAAGQACFISTGAFSWAVTTGDGPAPAANKHFKMIDASGYLQIVLAPNTHFAGMDVYTVSLNNQPFTVELYDAGSALIGTYSGQNPNFFGFASDDSISMIRLSSGGFSEIYLDRVDFSDAPSSAETPEAASLSYMALGMIAMWFAAGKRVPSMRRSKPLRA